MSEAPNVAEERSKIEDALADTSEADLHEILKRLTKSFQALEMLCGDMEEEQVALREESKHLNETISLMMQETRKLQISSDNTTEPVLDEDPLNVLGRFWERVRPRDNNQVLMNDNIGELKRKPNPDEAVVDVAKHLDNVRQSMRDVGLDDLEISAGQRLQDAQDHAKDLQKSATKHLEGIQTNLEEFRGTAQEQFAGAATALSGAGERLRTKTDLLLAQAQGGMNDGEEATAPLSSRISQHGEILRQQTTELHAKASGQLESARQAAEAAKSKLKEHTNDLLQTNASDHLQGAASALESSTKSLWKKASQNWDTFTGASSAAQDEHETTLYDTTEPECAVAEPFSIGGLEQSSNKDVEIPAKTAPREEAVSAVPVAVEETAVVEEATKEANIASAGEPEDAIIIATIVLEDGASEIIRVTARDRCKDVAHRFVQEHSLKVWFEEPLCKYLKKVEREAEKFPVEVKEELSEIRTKFK